WLSDPKKEHAVEKNDRVYAFHSGFWVVVQAYLKLAVKLNSAEKVILHGLFDIRVVAVLALFPWVLPKCYWVIWGRDLYRHTTPKKSILDHVKELLPSFVIRYVGNLVTYIPGDV